jgi:hypothetical protein
MPCRSLSLLLIVVGLAGCPGGQAELGDSCGGHEDCDGTLQCLNQRCVPQCQRAPECGDGYACDERGYCREATGGPGSSCESEVECAEGLSCQLGNEVHSDNRLNSTCVAHTASKPNGAACDQDTDCRNGTCALGRCVDLCSQTRDCAAGHNCVTIPHLLVSQATFSGCLPSQGSIKWSIPMNSPSGQILLPVPTVARSASLVMSVNDPGQKVGATAVLDQKDGTRLYSAPCSMRPGGPTCTPIDALDDYFEHRIRHIPAFGQSVMLMPSGTSGPLGPSVYRVDVSSFRANNAPGSAIPRVTAVVQLSPGALLDLHFFFLDLAGHPCEALTNRTTLDAMSARSAPYFQDTYLVELEAIFDRAGIKLGTLTYEDIENQHKLDSLDVTDVGELLRLGKYAGGINVFFVRSLSPIGLQAFAPNPGPAGLAGTRESGIVISLDTLCYRDWSKLARLTAHELARYMGLYHNVELEVAQNPSWRDLIDDNNDEPTSNLMFFSELGGATLSPQQIDILTRSPVLR